MYSNFLSKFRKYLKKAKQVHDTAFMNVEWDLDMKTPPPKTNEKAYFRTKESSERPKPEPEPKSFRFGSG